MGDRAASVRVAVASVASVVVERSILGNEPLFRVPAYHLQHPVELLAYAALGIVGGGVSLVFCKGLLSARRLFMGLPPWTRVWQPAIGGLMIGGLLVLNPQVMGVGYEYVDQALNGGLVLKTMVWLCALKLVATTVSYSSGNAGGIFAPSLYIGVVNAQQLAAAVESGHRSDPVGSLLDLEIVHAHADHPSEVVLERLAHTAGVLPIVSRDDTQRVLGVVTFPHIMRFMRKRPAASAAALFE